jgi:hypothetical protein
MLAYSELLDLKHQSASRDGANEGVLSQLLKEKEQVLLSTRKRLTWTINIVFPSLIPSSSFSCSYGHKKESLNKVLKLLLDDMLWMDPLAPDWSNTMGSVIARAYLQRLCIVIGKVTRMCAFYFIINSKEREITENGEHIHILRHPLYFKYIF